MVCGKPVDISIDPSWHETHVTVSQDEDDDDDTAPTVT
jgi:hypothetical protein